LSRKYQRGEKICQDIDDLRLVEALETGRDLLSIMIISTTSATISNIDNSPCQNHYTIVETIVETVKKIAKTCQGLSRL
jgi:hypothetical protein